MRLADKNSKRSTLAVLVVQRTQWKNKAKNNEKNKQKDKMEIKEKSEVKENSKMKCSNPGMPQKFKTKSKSKESYKSSYDVSGSRHMR